MIINYRSEDIRLDQDTGEFSWEGNKSKDLQVIKGLINTEKKKPRINAKVYYMNYMDAPYKVTVTSLVANGAWLTDSGRRFKLYSLSCLFEANDYNDKIVKRVKEIDAAIEKMQKERSTAVETMEHWTPPEPQEKKNGN